VAGLGVAAAALGADPTRVASATEVHIRVLYAILIEAENAHDIEKVRAMVWDSPDALFVAKTKTAAEGNWAGFWGREVVVDHLHELFAGTFRIDPDYSKEKIAFLAPTVAETYVPVDKMATDIALPIPVPPK